MGLEALTMKPMVGVQRCTNRRYQGGFFHFLIVQSL